LSSPVPPTDQAMSAPPTDQAMSAPPTDQAMSAPPTGSSHVGFFSHQAADLSQRSCNRARNASRCSAMQHLAYAEDQQRKRERDDVVEQPKQQQARQQVFFVELP